jgi:hypothetical protein
VSGLPEIPDHLPPGWAQAEAYQFFADALRLALDLPEQELREFVAECSETYATFARELRESGDAS